MREDLVMDLRKTIEPVGGISENDIEFLMGSFYILKGIRPYCFQFAHSEIGGCLPDEISAFKVFVDSHNRLTTSCQSVN